MYGCESWTIKQAESWRIDAFELWCWRRLASPLDCKEIQPVHPKGDQSWVFIGRTEAEAETPNTLATWCEELTYWKRLWCWERLKAGGEGDDRGWDGWMASPTQWTWVWVNSRSWWWTGKPGVLRFMGSQSQTRLSDWTELTMWWGHKKGPEPYRPIQLSVAVLKQGRDILILSRRWHCKCGGWSCLSVTSGRHKWGSGYSSLRIAI